MRILDEALRSGRLAVGAGWPLRGMIRLPGRDFAGSLLLRRQRGPALFSGSPVRPGVGRVIFPAAEPGVAGGRHLAQNAGTGRQKPMQCLLEGEENFIR